MSDTSNSDGPAADDSALSELLIPETSPAGDREGQRTGSGDGPRGGEEEIGRGQSLVNVHQGSREEPDPTADVAVDSTGTVPAAQAAEGDPLGLGFPIAVPALPAAGPGVSVVIRITHVPDSVILSAGTAKGGGVVELTPDELPGLLALPADGGPAPAPAPFGLEIILTNLETGEQEVVSSTVGVVRDSDASVNQVMDGAANGTAVGVTALAVDPDPADTVTYSLTDDAGGRFAIDPNTGVITVADGTLLDSSVAPNHAVTIQATSSDGSTSTETFVINVTNGTPVGPVTDSDGTANTISENAANGSPVGLTGLATDADATDTVTYTLTDNAGGRFAIDANMGVVTVADTSLLDYETATSHTVTVQATSTDGSTSTETFTITLTDDTSEAAVGPVTDSDGTANTISESVANGSPVGLTGLATDADATDTVTYSLTDNAGGRFAIDANTGVVTVADTSLLDYETAPSHTVTIQATSTDGSTSTETFTINLTDDTSEAAIGPVTDSDGTANTISESAANGAAVGLTGLATDADATDTVTYSLTDNAGGRFAIDANTGVVTVADTSLLDFETATSHTVTIQATSTDGSTSTETFTITLTDDTSEAAVGPVTDSDGTANSISESAANGAAVGLTGLATDADATDTVTYSLTDNAGGRFAIDANTGVVTVADTSLLDYETATSHTVTIQATSTDGSTSTETFTINLTDDISEAAVGPVTDSDGTANTISESAANGAAVGLTGLATDADATDTVTYSLTDNAGGRFAIDANTGVVTVADTSLLDFETATSHIVTIQATSTDGSTSTETFTINLTDDTSEAAVGPVTDSDGTANTISESVANGAAVGLTGLATDADATDTVTYSLTDNAGGRFAIDANTGVVTVADTSLLDYETATSHTVTIQATSTDGSTSTETFTINLTDDTSEAAVGPVTDSDGTANTISESAANGAAVGLTGLATDADATDTVTYSLTDNAGGRFAINANTGVVTVADTSLLDYETATSHTVTIQATSTDGSTNTETFTINLTDDTSEAAVGPVVDSDGTANTISESVANGSAVGLTGLATDADTTDTVTYSLTDNAGGRFAIDANTGVVTVADNSLLDYETATSHTVTIQATSTDGSTSTETFTITLTDDTSESVVGPVTDSDGTANTISESVANGTPVGLTGLATDADATDTVTYSLTDNAGGRFAIDANTGVVTVADTSLLDFETATSHTVTVQATSTDGSTSTETFTITLTDDTSEAAVGPVTDSDGTANTISESVANGAAVGLTGLATDADATDTVTYSLTDDAGGRFAIDANTGVVTVADTSLLDYETATSHTVTVQAISTDGSTSTETFTINLTDDMSEAAVGPVTDSDGTANTISESVANGAAVGLTGLATDVDATDTVTYSLTDNAGGRFAIDANTGVVTVADTSLLNYETATSHTVTIQATSTDGSTSTETFTITLTDDTSEAAVGPVTDSDGTANTISESVANGSAVGLTGLATDADATDTVTYSLTDNAGGRFAIDANTGVVTVADTSLLDYETAPSHTVTVQATSTDGSTSTETFTINLTDDTSEAAVGPVTDSDGTANTISESAANGSAVGLTGLATDADATDTVTYSLTDNAGGRFAIDANTGVVTVADTSLLDYETATSHTVTIQATSTDGSTSTETFTITLTDDVSEAAVGPVTDSDGTANTISESVANGAAVGLTGLATDADATDTVTYSLTDNAGGRFAIDANTGVVTVADTSLLDFETATSHTVTIQATSTDGSTSTETFTINLTDDTSEAAVGPVTDSDGTANTISESVANGSAVGLTGLATDADATDTVTYSLTDNAGGRFAIDANTGVVTVADTSLLDFETATSHTVTIQATSTDGSTSTETFTINLTDDTSEAAVGPVTDSDGNANTISESVANGAAVGLTGLATDADATDTVTYSLTDNAGGRFAIDANTGVVTVADTSLLDYETATSHTVTIQATSTDGSTSTETFTINLTDANENGVGPISDSDASANTISEAVANGAVVGLTALASDPDTTDTVTYSLTDNAGGRFAIDANTGVVTVADTSLLDYETATSHTVTIQATSTDGSTSTETFTINLTDDTSEAAVGPVTDSDGAANTISESAVNGSAIGLTGLATDADATDTVTYSLTDNAGGRFAIDANTGVVTVADTSLLDYETATSHTVTVQATSTDGSTSTETFTINLTDDTSEAAVGPVIDSDGTANTISESVANGAAVGLTGLATDADATDTVTYSLTDNAGGRFAIDANTGVVTVADTSLLDFETATSHTVTIQATSTDGSTSTETFTINLTDDTSEAAVGPVTDSDGTANTISEAAVNGAAVGLTGLATDADATDTVTYSLTDNSGGRFAIDANTGVVTVADTSLLDYETATSHTVTIQATSTDGSTSTETFTINLTDDTSEAAVGPVTDSDGTANTISESAANGAAVGLTGLATDADATDTVTYSLMDNAGGRFAIDANTGVVTVADTSLLDYETATSHTVTVQATSTDGSTSTETFTINLTDDTSEAAVGPVTDSDGTANTISESAANGAAVGLTGLATDADATDTVTYSLTDNAGGRFAIDANTGVVTVADTSLLDYETATSHTVTIQATSTDGSTSTETFTINLTDDTSEAAVGPVTDSDGTANTISESAANGAAVGLTGLATDADATDTVTYSLTNNAGGRFAIDANTGVVTVADTSLLDYETATSHTVTVQATSTDGSTSTETFTITLTDDTSEAAVGPVTDSDGTANTISESAANGAPVGLTGLATDADATDTVTYSLTDNASGRFAIDANTGVVTVADTSLLNFETAPSHTVTIQATSTDGSTSTETFTINLTDDTSEAAVGPVTDSDGTANTISESVANGSVVGLTGLATDADATDTVTYTLTDNAGGRFAIDANTGVVTVADTSLLDFETATSHTVTIQATSTDGSTSTETFTINLTDDTSEAAVGPVTDSDGTANTISESVANGAAVGLTGLATDADATDTVTYSLTDNAGGRFAIDANTGVVTVADTSLLDFETATSHTVTIQATSTDGSTSTETFTINLTDDTSEAAVGPVTDSDGTANTISESVANGSAVGLTGLATDADATDTITYSLTDNAGGRFAIDANTGVVTVADTSLLDYETATSHTVTIQATSTDGSTSTETFTINLTDDTSEATVGPVTDSDGAANTISESVANGSVVGLTGLATDADATDTVTYSLTDNAGVRFAIDADTGVVTVADTSLLDYETATSHTVTIQATSTDGSTSTETFTINLIDDTSEAAVGPVTDSDGTANTISESAANGTAVGLTGLATDADATDTVTYSLTDNAGGRFAIDANTGVVTIADTSLLDFETATSHSVTIQATSTDGSTSTETFTINLTDDTSEAAVGPVTDSDGTANTISESAANGAAVGLTGLATDADATDTVTYSLTDNAGGRFSIDANTGVVTVADASLLDYETATSHTVTIQATSTDGSTSTETFTINLTDDTSEAAVGPVTDSDGTANTISESVANGAAVGLTGLATDADATDTVTYSLTDDAGGRFAIDANTGVVTVADTSLLDYETATSHTVTIQATSTDGSTSAETFTINLTDDTSEASVGPVTDSDGTANTISESVANGAAVGLTGLATDADATDTVTYSLTDNAGGRFAIDANTGVVTVADTSLLDYETATSHTVTIQATSTDGSTSTETFTINLTDDTSEAAVGPVTDSDGTANTISESVTNGIAVGLTGLATDADATDTVTYTLTDNAGGRFAIDADTGVVTVADTSLLDYETATSHTVTIQATSTDGSTSTETFTINLIDDTSEAAVGPVTDSDGTANTISESAANGAAVGLTGLATDADATDTVTYSLTDNAGGRFSIDANTGVVTVADASLLDYETATSHTVTIQATSTDGSTSTETFTINLTDDTSEAAVGPVTDSDGTANTISESVANGAAVGLTGLATDADATDTVTYSLTDNAGGRFAIDANTGVVTVADTSLLDYETATSHTVTIQATSTDGSTSTETFTITLTDDISEAAVGPVTDSDGTANTISESVANGAAVGLTGLATDADATDTVTYSLTDNAGGRFAIDANTGVVTVADTSLLDYETATSHTVTIQATSTDGSTSTETFTINLTDDTSEAVVGPVTDSDGTANTISESVANGAAVGLTGLATDADATDTVTYSLTDDAGGRFAIDANTGVVTVADTSLLDYETATSHTVTIQATSTDGSTSTETFTINLTDDTSEAAVGPVTDSDGTANTISESVANGAAVGLTGLATDADATDTVTYSLTDNAGGRFAIDANTGVVTVADTSLLDFETATSHTVTIQATSTDGSTSTETFTINLTDDTSEAAVGPVSDSNASANIVSESVANGSAVGLTGLATDADATDTVTYSLTDNAGGRFAIDANTGVVTVADATLLDYETATSHTVTIQATSTDGSTSTETFTIDLENVLEAPTMTTSDSTGDEDTAIALDIQPTFLDDGATHTVTITGVPAGATLSAGTDQGGGTWSLTPAQLTGLSVTPPNDSDVDFQLGVTIMSDDGSGTLSTSPQTINVTVDPVADAPTLSVTDPASGSEDGAVPVTFSTAIQNMESSPNFSVTVSGVPSGATLNVGTDNGDGSWTLTAGQINNVYVMPPAGSDTDFQLSISATADQTQSLIDTGFDSSADGFTYADDTFSTADTDDDADDYASGAYSSSGGNTGGGLTVDLGGIDGDDIEGISGGWQTTFNVPSNATGSLTFKYRMQTNDSYESDEYSQILVSIDGSLVGTGGNSYVAQVAGGGDTGWQTVTLDLGSLSAGNHTLILGGYNNEKTQSNELTEIQFDDVQLTTGGTMTVNETFDVSPDWVDLNISASLNDLDGSESLAITIGNVPNGSTLSAGTDNGDGSWTLAPGDLTGLKMFTPENYSGTVQLTVTATSTDGADTNSVSDTIDVTIGAVADTPTLTLTDPDTETQLFHSTFETGGPTAFIDGTVDGWSPGSGNEIELWNESDQPGDAVDGDQFVEINFEGDGGFPDAGVIERTVSTAADMTYELSFDVSPRPGFESYMDFQVSAIDVSSGAVLETVTIGWDGNTVSEMTWEEHSLQFVGTGGDVRLVFTDTGTVHPEGRGAFVDDIRFTQSSTTPSAGEPINLPAIAAALTDTDGSETLTIVISEIPDGAVLSDGTNSFTANSANGFEVDISTWDPSSLTITTDPGHDGDFELTVQAISEESSGGKAINTRTINVEVADPQPTGSGSSDAYRDAVMAHDPAGYWRLGENSGSTASDEVGSHDGTYRNGASPGETGALNGDSNTAVELDGNNDHVRVGGTEDFEISNGTIQMWINPDDVNTEQWLFTRDDDDKMYLRVKDGKVEFESNGDTVFSSGTLSTGQWYMITAVFGAGGMKLYVDDSLAGSSSKTDGMGDNEARTYIGADKDGGKTFDGTIDEVVIYDTQLSPSDISNLYDIGTNGGSGGSGGSATEGTTGDDNITGTSSADTIYGYDGVDTLDGAAGDDTLYGGDGDDTIDGGAGNDTIYGGDGNDDIDGGTGNDTIYGGLGNDTIDGEDGNDTIYGGAGDDHLTGGAGADTLYGGSGADRIYGGAGDDVLDGGTGNDSLYGGDGNDLFIFQEGSGRDQVDGGTGGGWIDTIELQDAAGGNGIGSFGADWTLSLDTGSISASGSNYIDLSNDASGTIILQDGSEVAFNAIERIEW